MDLNGLRYALSALALIMLVLAVVMYFSHNLHSTLIFIGVGVAFKLAEIVVRILLKNKQKKQRYGE